MDDQLRLDRHLTDFFAEAKATSLTPDEREHSRFAIESFIIAESVSLTAEGRLGSMTHGRESAGSPHLFLDEKEKRHVRKNLIEFMQQNPRFVPDVKVETISFSLYRIFELAFPRFALGLLMFVGVGAGVTFASQASVPGDFLYPFKVNVYEPVVSKLATSDTSQAAWEARRAQNRLKEAAKLSAESKLTQEAATDLRVKFEKHLEHAQKNIDVLNAHGKTEVATSIQTTLESYLDSNSSIVREIAVNGNANVSAAAAITAKEPSSESSSSRPRGASTSRGPSLVERVQSIISSLPTIPSSSDASQDSSPTAASSSSVKSKKDGSSSSVAAQAPSSSSSKKNEQSSENSKKNDSSSSVTADANVDVDVDLEANLGTQVSSVASVLVPALFKNMMNATSSAMPPLPNLLP